MAEAFLLSRILLQFGDADEDLLTDLSAAARTPDGSLWVGSDELLTLERLSPLEPGIYGNHQPFFIGNFVDLFDDDDEIDIEGMDYNDGYLWLTGSHSTKRNKPKGKKAKKDIRRLTEIKTDLNRYLLARIPIINGNPFRECTDPQDLDRKLTAASLAKTDEFNVLFETLKSDPHLGPFVANNIPSKDNGLDIEGLAVKGDRVFLGLRGPVLRGWAVILEFEVYESEPGVLHLKEIGENDRVYKKHFVDLDGLGIRELAFWDDNLIVLAGPTMDLDGAMRVFCLRDILDSDEQQLLDRDSKKLSALFDFPYRVGCDRAEGLAIVPCLNYEKALFVVYDSPHANRMVGKDAIFADVYRLPDCD